MPLDTLDRAPPPFFKQGPSALSKLVLLSALALFLMVADARFHLVQPLRAVIATVLYPAQWVALQPVQWTRDFSGYLTDLKTARKTEEAARRKLAEQSQRAGQVEQLLLENTRLRQLLALRERTAVPSQAAQVLYDATDPYSRRVVIDKGQLQGIAPGSPVMDGDGVLGQVTQVYPFVSEVTLLIDRDQVIPVVNTRTGTRGVAYGDPTAQGGLLELRYMPAGEDVKEGDLLATSGIDGVYPPGLPVARVASVDRQSDSSFARILCQPLARLQGTSHVMVLTPTSQVAPAPTAAASQAAAPATPASKPGGKAAAQAGAASAAKPRASRPPPRRSAP